MLNFRFHLPTDLRFGEGLLNDDTLYKVPYEKVLIVTTKNISSARYGELETIQKKLRENGTEPYLYDQVTRPLTSNTILDAARKARSLGVDAILAHGGGKVIDAAKVIARMTREKDDYLSGWLTSQLAPPFEHEPLDVIAVPTTLTVVASLNHKVYIYDGSKSRYERLKNPSFTPKMVWLDPTLFTTLSEESVRNTMSDVLIRAFDLLRQEVSPLHTDLSIQALRRIIRYGGEAAKTKDVQSLSMVAYAHVLVGSLYVKKPYFPLHMLHDTVQGFHPELHYGRFLYFAGASYIELQLDEMSPRMRTLLKSCFKNLGENTLTNAFRDFFEGLNQVGDDMKTDRTDTKYPEDYLVHLKVLFPKFASLKDQTVYRLIEDTML